MVSPERKKFLQKRLRAATAIQPEVKSLKHLLLKLGGEFLVAPPSSDQDVYRLITDGFSMSGPVTIKKMRESQCHQNVAAVWRARKFGVVAIGSGYALSEDGLWRQHSWGIRRDGVLETTEERLKYFGLLLQGVEADHFAETNPY